MTQLPFWGGEPKQHPKFPDGYFKTPTLTVASLIQELSKLPPDTPIGACCSWIHGWVNGIKRVTTDEHGLVILDLTEEGLYADEVKVL